MIFLLTAPHSIFTTMLKKMVMIVGIYVMVYDHRGEASNCSPLNMTMTVNFFQDPYKLRTFLSIPILLLVFIMNRS